MKTCPFIFLFFFPDQVFAVNLDVQHLIQITFVRTGKKSNESIQIQMPESLIQCLVNSFAVFRLISRDFGESS